MIYSDKDFEIHINIGSNDCYCDYKVYSIYIYDGKTGYISEDGSLTYSIEQAQPLILGSIKWDGCVNYEYPEAKDCMMHRCGLKQFEQEHEIWKKIYEFAEQLMGDKWYK